MNQQPSLRLDAPRSRRAAVAATIVAVCAATLGCAGYRVGAESLYPPDIQTIYVPMFQSDSYRRNISEWLTEAVAKEIEKQTPYRVVATPDADSVLSGRLLNDTKRIIVESPTDEPRETQVQFYLEVTWVDRQGAVLAQGQRIPLPPAVATIVQDSSVVPEVGQSIATAQQEVIQKLAEQVVSLMQVPW